jgi:hypothetical protein
MSTDPSDNAVVNPPSAAHRVRVIIFRVVAALAGLFFVVAVVLMASAPWMLLQPDQDVRTELNRWFLTVAGSVDAITAGVLLALAQQPRRTLLVVELVGAVIVAGAIILPSSPPSPPSSRSWWCRSSPTRTGVTCEPFRPGGPACHGQSSSSPHWPVPRFSSRRLLHTRARSAEQIRQLAGAGGWTMPSMPPCSRSPACSPLAADPARAS